jgi:titin
MRRTRFGWLIVTALAAAVAFLLPSLAANGVAPRASVMAYLVPDPFIDAPAPAAPPAAAPAPARTSARNTAVTAPTGSGPTPPGGVTVVPTGGDGTCPCVAAAGGRTVHYTNLVPASYRDLYWGPADVNGVQLAFDGTADAPGETLTYAPGSTEPTGAATWNGSATFTGSATPVQTRFRLQITAPGGTVALVPAGSVGVVNGSVVAHITGTSFDVQVFFEATAAFQPARTVFDTTPMNGSSPTLTTLLLNSFNSGFWWTLPTAPTAAAGVAGSGTNQGASLSWTAPADDGGRPVTGYVVTPYIGATAQTPITLSDPATTATVGGLTNGTAYTFTVAAINSVGTGAPSAPSGPITPNASPARPPATAAPSPSPSADLKGRPTAAPAPSPSSSPDLNGRPTPQPAPSRSP